MIDAGRLKRHRSQVKRKRQTLDLSWFRNFKSQEGKRKEKVAQFVLDVDPTS